MDDLKPGDFVYGCHNKFAHMSAARNFYMAVVLRINNEHDSISVLTLHHAFRKIEEIDSNRLLYAKLMDFFSRPHPDLGRGLYEEMPAGTAQVMTIDKAHVSKTFTLEQALEHMELLSGQTRPNNLKLLYNYKITSIFQQAMPPSSL